MINWKSIEFLEEYNEELLTENLLLHLKIEKAIEYIKQRKLEVDEEELQWVEMKVEEYNTEYNKLLEILGDKEIEEIPLFDGTLEQLNNLSIIGDKDNE